MRPHDIVILIKMAISDKQQLLFKELSQELFISPSEITESLQRNKTAGLINFNKTEVNRNNLFDFLIHGFKYVFPAQLGPTTIGFPTSTGHESMRKHFTVTEFYVWPDFNGTQKGTAVEPLYVNQVKAIQKDKLLYEILSLMDVLRLERVREVNFAKEQLKKRLLK